MGSEVLAFVAAIALAIIGGAIGGFVRRRRQRQADADRGAAEQRAAMEAADAALTENAARRGEEIHHAPPEDMQRRLDRWRSGGAL